MHSMSTWMALFGLVWLLRVRGSLCGCTACKRARIDTNARCSSVSSVQCDEQATSATEHTLDERAPFDVIALQQYTRDVTVQTDFDDDEVEDLEKIELTINEESNVSNYDSVREPLTSPEGEQKITGSYQYLMHHSTSNPDDVWETTDVTLERGASGLGLSIAGSESGGDISITRIAPNGAAKDDGQLQTGDILLQVNDISVEGAPHSVAVNALQKAGNVVRLKVRRARRSMVVKLCRGARGLGLGIAGGADDAGGEGIFISHIAVGGAAHHDGRLKLGDKILAVRDEQGRETSLIGVTHGTAVAALRSTGDHVTLVVMPAAGSIPPVARTAPLYSTRTQATSCSTLHDFSEEELNKIPRCVRMVRLVRTGSRLGMDIVGGLGGDTDDNSGVEDDTYGVFVSGVSVEGAAYGLLHRGDRILSVNGRDLTRATHEQAAAALKYSGSAVTIAAQYQREQYERLRARIRAINAAAMSPHAHIPVRPDVHSVYPSMSTWMALFGLVWLLRVRGSLCGCTACKRARIDTNARCSSVSSVQCDEQATSATEHTLDERAPFDVIALQQYTRDVTVQTDFDDDEVEDLEKIELTINEESNVSNYDSVREPLTSPEGGQKITGSYQYLMHHSTSNPDDVWETTDVTLERGASGLGLSIAGSESGGDISITRIAPNGAAKDDGQLQTGDILLQVNDISVEGAPHSVAVNALQKAGNVVRLKVRRARRSMVVKLCRGARGLGLGIAGGADDAGGEGIFISHIAVGGAAHHDGRLKLGDKILAVRDEHGRETSLIGVTHGTAVAALRSAGDHVTLVVMPAAGSIPPVARTAPLYSTRTQATSCSTLHDFSEEELNKIPRCVRMVRLVRTGSRLGMDIVGGLGGDTDDNSGVEDDTYGVFVSGVSVEGAAYGLLHRGDRILSVNGRDLTRATHEQAAAALKYSGSAVTIAAQYQREQYERLRARIRAINAAAMSPHAHIPVRPDVHSVYPR